MFSCGPGLTLPLADLCDGVADCGLIGGLRPADDELAVICDSKLEREVAMSQGIHMLAWQILLA